MTIVPLIQRIVKNRFGTYFDGIESFFRKTFSQVRVRDVRRFPAGGFPHTYPGVAFERPYEYKRYRFR